MPILQKIFNVSSESGSGSGGTADKFASVNTFADLPTTGIDVGTIYRVLTSTGIRFINRKLAGFYGYNGASWDRVTELEANKVLYDNTTSGLTATNSGAALDELQSIKEPNITATTSADYYRGDKTFQTLTMDVVAETPVNKYFTSSDKSKLNGIESGATADQTDTEIKTAYENNANTNVFTDTEKTKLSGIETGAEVNVNADWNAISGDAQILNKPTTITSAEQTKLGHISVTQAVDLDTMESNIATNNAKVSNATHTGDVTGSTALTISDEAVTNAKIAHVATGTVKGRATAGTGDVEDLDIDTTLKTALNLTKSDVGLNNVVNADTTNASNISSGTLAEARLPAINADNTTVSNLEVDNLKPGVLDTDLNTVSANDDTLASAKAIKAYSDSLPGATNLSLSNSDLSVFTAGNNKIEIKPNAGSNSESLELTGASTTGVFVGINTNHNVLPLSACTKNGSAGYTVSDAIAAVLYDSTDIFPSGTYGTYGIYMGADVQNGNGWIQTGRTNATQNNGNAFNLLLQPSAGNVGIGTTSATAKLTVNGSVSKTSGSFDIEHPDPKKKDTHRLRHYFVETPSAGGNIYKYQIECKEGENYIDLPNYFEFLNKDALVWVNPFKHFGRAWGEVIEDKKIKIVAEQKGLYNILVFGDRKDEAAMKDFNKYGIEYQPNK